MGARLISQSIAKIDKRMTETGIKAAENLTFDLVSL
jgi:hypothetical protein